MIEPSDAAELIEKAEAAEAIEPRLRNEPIEAIDRTEPFEAIERNESSDHSDHFELAVSITADGAGASPPPQPISEANRTMPAIQSLASRSS